MVNTIFSGTVMSLYNNKSNFTDFVKYIVDNRTTVYENTNVRNILTGIPSISSPIISLYNVFSEMAMSSKMIFTFINSAKGISIADPALINLPFFDPDLKEMTDVQDQIVNSISMFPEYKDRIVFNIFPIWSDKTGTVTDKHALVHRVVRDVFARSYTDLKHSKVNSFWLSADIIIDLAEIYGKVYASLFSRKLELTVEETNKLALLFAIYFTQICSTYEDSMIHRQLRGIAQLPNIIDVEVAIKNINSGRLPNNLNELELVIKELVAQRFSLTALFTISRSLSTDNNMSQIALEYPPYWMYMVVSMMSKESKTYLYRIVQNQSALKQAANNLMKRLTRQMFDNVWKD